jgi:hypothetical protein
MSRDVRFRVQTILMKQTQFSIEITSDSFCLLSEVARLLREKRLKSLAHRAKVGIGQRLGKPIGIQLYRAI